jgi:hypothetical protein
MVAVAEVAETSKATIAAMIALFIVRAPPFFTPNYWQLPSSC